MRFEFLLTNAYKEIDKAVAKKDFLKAAEVYEILLETFPKEKSFLIKCADIYSYLEQYEKALTHYLKAANIHPNVPGLLLKLANTYYHLNQFDNAVLSYQRIIKKSNDNTEIAEAWYKTGEILKKFKQIKDAENCFTKAIAINQHKNAYQSLSFLNSLQIKDEVLNQQSDPDDNNSLENRIKFYSPKS